MDAANTDDLPLYMVEQDAAGNKSLYCLGFFPPDILRPMLTRKEARFDKCDKTGERRVILRKSLQAIERARALTAAGATQGLSTTYTEDLYPDSPDQLRHKRDNDIPVEITATLETVLKKLVRRDGVFVFVPWTANDKFRRRRWDPDNIRPLHPTERIAVAAIRGE